MSIGFGVVFGSVFVLVTDNSSFIKLIITAFLE